MSEDPYGFGGGKPDEYRVGDCTGSGLDDHFYVFLDGRVYVAPGKRLPGPVFTADLYTNLEDLRAGHVAEPGVTLEVDRA